MRCVAAAASRPRLWNCVATHRRAASVPRYAACACSSTSSPHGSAWRLWAPTRRATAVLAQLLADVSLPGDVLCLHGGVGTGKSYFCREFVRAVTDDPYLAVPSPTFLLLQAYESPNSMPVHHFDLYRLTGYESLGNLELSLNLRDSFSRAVSLVEWADRLGPLTPERRLEVHIKEATVPAEQLPSQAADENVDENDGEVDDIRPRDVLLRPYGERWEQVLATVAGFLSAPPPQTPSLGGLRILHSM